MGKGKTELSIEDALKRLFKKLLKKATLICVVLEVDKVNYTVTVQDEATELQLEVMVKAREKANKKALIAWPGVGSYVLCTRVENGDEWVLGLCTEVDEIWLGGDAYSSVKAETLITELNKTREVVSAIVTAFSWTPVANDGGAALKAAFTAAISGKAVGDYSGIKNEAVKHG